MNIKSEFLNKTIPWFPNFSLAMLLISIVIGGFLSLIIIGFEQGIYVKLIALAAGMVVLLVWTYDTSVTDKEDRNKTLKQGLSIFILTILIMETPLYFNSHRDNQTTKISIIIIDKTKDGSRIKDNDEDSSNDKFIQLKYKVVEFYDLETNKRIGYRKVQENENNQLTLYTDIVGKETYINYLPFFIYDVTFRYIRDTNTTDG